MDVTWMDLFGRRLSVASAAAMVLFGALGVFCVLQLARVNRATTDIATRSLPSVKALTDIGTNTANFRLAEFQHILASDDGHRDSCADEHDREHHADHEAAGGHVDAMALRTLFGRALAVLVRQRYQLRVRLQIAKA